MRVFLAILMTAFLFARTPDAVGVNGAVSSSNAYATKVGLDILQKGGNAVDAAIAVGFTLAVVHPSAGNLGGGGFMMVRTRMGEVLSLDFREVAPLLAHPDLFLDENGDVVAGKSLYSSWAAGVPGSVAGLAAAYKRFASIPWAELIAPAIRLARNGFALEINEVQKLNAYGQLFARDEYTGSIFTKEGGWALNDILVQDDLGNTLARIAENGWKEIYTGKTGEALLATMEKNGGLISAEDLASYEAIWREPLSFEYRGYKVHSMPPASSGGLALAGILNQIDNVNLGEIPFHSAEHVQLLSEVEKRVYADRAHFMGDMDRVPVPIDMLLSQAYSDARFQTIDSVATPSADISHGDIPFEYSIEATAPSAPETPSAPAPESEETTHFSVVDAFGMAVSVTTTLNRNYGCGIAVEGAGFLLNNEMDDFSSKPGVPNSFGLVGGDANAIEAGKRMLSSMTPTIVDYPDGSLALVLGSPGGSTIITTVAQVITNVVDYGMNIQDAVELPRVHHQWLPDEIKIEAHSLGAETIAKLESLGQTVLVRSPIGEANCIQVARESHIIMAVGDSRRGASAMAY